MDDAGEKRLCAAVIRKAIDDAVTGEGRGAPRVNAVAWLVSRAATPWFDMVGIGQRAALERMHWIVHASDVLSMPPPPEPHDCRVTKTRPYCRVCRAEQELRTIQAGLEVLK